MRVLNLFSLIIPSSTAKVKLIAPRRSSRKFIKYLEITDRLRDITLILQRHWPSLFSIYHRPRCCCIKKLLAGNSFIRSYNSHSFIPCPLSVS